MSKKLLQGLSAATNPQEKLDCLHENKARAIPPAREEEEEGEEEALSCRRFASLFQIHFSSGCALIVRRKNHVFLFGRVDECNREPPRLPFLSTGRRDQIPDRLAA